jgi:hypothetical protein
MREGARGGGLVGCGRSRRRRRVRTRTRTRMGVKRRTTSIEDMDMATTLITRTMDVTNIRNM